MNPPSAQEIESLARVIAQDLCMTEDAPAGGNPNRVAAVVAQVLRENFATEATIHREAERTLDSMGSATAGMDRARLLQGLRERIAKKRGFVL